MNSAKNDSEEDFFNEPTYDNNINLLVFQFGNEGENIFFLRKDRKTTTFDSKGLQHFRFEQWCLIVSKFDNSNTWPWKRNQLFLFSHYHMICCLGFIRHNLKPNFG